MPRPVTLVAVTQGGTNCLQRGGLDAVEKAIDVGVGQSKVVGVTCDHFVSFQDKSYLSFQGTSQDVCQLKSCSLFVWKHDT